MWLSALLLGLSIFQSTSDKRVLSFKPRPVRRDVQAAFRPQKEILPKMSVIHLANFQKLLHKNKKINP